MLSLRSQRKVMTLRGGLRRADQRPSRSPTPADHEIAVASVDPEAEGVTRWTGIDGEHVPPPRPEQRIHRCGDRDRSARRWGITWRGDRGSPGARRAA